MSSPQIVFDTNDKNEIFRIHGVNGNRRTPIARLDPEKKTIYWKDEETRDAYHKSLDAYLSVEKVNISTVLLEGQTPDIRPARAGERKAKHPMQGDLTPEYLDDLLANEPIIFENTLGVMLKPGTDLKNRSKDPRDDWRRADVVRTVSGPTVESRGGEYVSVKFKATDQIIARRASHLTYTEREIFRGDTAIEQADPFKDPYGKLAKSVKDAGFYDIPGIGKIEVISKDHAAASAGARF